MSKEIELFTGDDWEVGIDISREGSGPFNASGGVVKASLVKLGPGDPTTLIDAITQNEGATGADWSNGLILVEFPRANTSNVAHRGTAFIELQVEKNGKRSTWPRVQVEIKKGSIA